AAPLFNPDGTPGIKLWIDDTGHVPYSQLVNFSRGQPNSIQSCSDATNPQERYFADLKAYCFDKVKRGGVYHYCVWAAGISQPVSGMSDMTDFETKGTGGDDCVVATP